MLVIEPEWVDSIDGFCVMSSSSDATQVEDETTFEDFDEEAAAEQIYDFEFDDSEEVPAPTVIEAIIALATRRTDGTDFSEADREKYIDLISHAAMDCLTSEDIEISRELLRTYKKQLECLGIEYDRIKFVTGGADPKDNTFEHERPSSFEELVVKDVADVTLNDNGVETTKFLHSRAAQSIVDKMPVVMGKDDGLLYHWHNDIWRPNADEVIHIKLNDLVGEAYNTHHHKEVTTLVKKIQSFNPAKFDADPYLLGCKNCVVDLRTGIVRPYVKEDYITYQIPVSYDPNAKCPLFLKFIGEIAPDCIDRMTMIDWFTIHGFRKNFPYVYFLLGLGRNGKGVYEQLLERFFGGAFRSMRIEETTKGFAGASFQGCLGLIISEAGEDSRKGKKTIPTSFVKMVTGDGLIDSDVKYKDRVRFKPFFKTTFDCNDMPAIEDRSKGWKERFIKSNLPFSFVDDPDTDNPLERQRDPQLLEKLSTDEELSGILNLVIYRAAEIAKTNKIIKRSGKEMFDEYDAQSSSAQTFLDQFCEYDPGVDYNIPSNQIYKAYEIWCQYTVSEIVVISQFGKDLTEFCSGLKGQRKYVDKKRVTVYPGLLFNKPRYDVAITALKQRLDAGQVVDRSGQVDGQVDMGPQMSNGQVGQANMWNNIVRKFGS